jgi:hypothetical protein
MENAIFIAPDNIEYKIILKKIEKDIHEIEMRNN